VLRSKPCDVAPAAAGPVPSSRFVVYVEGPSDCYILRTWAGLVSVSLSRRLAECAVILGGRRPARALEHFRGLRDANADGLRGICVLDRDGHGAGVDGEAPEGLDFFTWRRRHIESYLLVPSAMRRCMRMVDSDPRLHDLLGDIPRVSEEEALRSLDAKRLLASKGALARDLGRSLSPSRIARCMLRADLHPDVLELLARLKVLAGEDATGS
jgi:hypothetical protein